MTSGPGLRPDRPAGPPRGPRNGRHRRRQRDRPLFASIASASSSACSDSPSARAAGGCPRGSSGLGAASALIWQPQRTRASMIASSPARCPEVETTMGPTPFFFCPNRTNELPRACVPGRWTGVSPAARSDAQSGRTSAGGRESPAQTRPASGRCRQPLRSRARVRCDAAEPRAVSVPRFTAGQPCAPTMKLLPALQATAAEGGLHMAQISRRAVLVGVVGVGLAACSKPPLG